jgi:hypothetical protein
MEPLIATIKESKMWAVKVDRNGRPTEAVLRRMENCKLDLESHESRAKFGYCYLDMLDG